MFAKRIIGICFCILCALSLIAQMEKGYRGFVEIEHNFGTAKDVDYKNDDWTWDWSYGYEETYFKESCKNIICIQSTHGYQFSSLFFLGGGVGVSIWKYNNTIYSHTEEYEYDEYRPNIFRDSESNSRVLGLLYVEPRFDFPSHSRYSLFQSTKIGTSFVGSDGDQRLYVVFSIGLRYQINRSYGADIMLNYRMSECEFPGNGNYGVERRSRRIDGIGMSVGFDF